MPSAKRASQIAVLALCGAIGAGALTGCETTQEKASAQRAESERILEARAKRQVAREHHKNHADRTKTGLYGPKSSRRHENRKGEG